jgi:hypothetical protein
MKTIQVHQVVHDLPTTTGQSLKKNGKPARPAKGEPIGVMVARVVDDSHYAIAVSLCNPGRVTKGGLVGDDKFHAKTGLKLALGSMVLGEDLPRVCVMPASTQRSKNIQAQYDGFILQAAKIFKDKSRRTALPA